MIGLNIVGWGTLNFKIDDENGRTHNISVLYTVHIPDLPLVLLSPHKWAQNLTNGTTETTGATSTVLRFHGYAKTICLNPCTNTPNFISTPVTLRYQEFSGTINHFDEDSLLSSEHVVTDNDGTDPEGGDAENEYDDEEIPISAQEVVDTIKIRQQQSGNVLHPTIGPVNHSESHPHANDAQRLTMEN